MRIRNATISDKEEIAKLLFELLNVKDIEEAKQTFLRELKLGHRYIVLKKDNSVIGLVSWILHGRPKHGLAELYHIVTTKEQRGKGIGRMLVNGLIGEANKEYNKYGSRLRKLFLLTRSNNEDAIKFYEKVGLRHETTLKSHFYEEKDELVMSRFF